MTSTLSTSTSTPANLPTKIQRYTINLSALSPSTPFSTIQLSTAPLPIAPAGHVLVKMHAAALNYRDLLAAHNSPLYMPTTTGIVPLLDGAGSVVSTSSSVKFPSGSKVIITTNTTWLQGYDVAGIDAFASLGGGNKDGTLTQYIVAREEILVAAPKNLSWVEAAALGAATATAWNLLYHGPAPLKAGDTVLTQGTGGVSAAVIQFASAAGATVIATSSTDEKLQLAKKLGAKHLINYRTNPAWEETAKALANGGKGVDHVVDVAGASTILQSVVAARQGGLVSLVGFVGGVTQKIEPNIIFQIIGEGKTVRGVLSASKPMVEEMVKAVEAMGIVPYVGKVFKWAEAKEAYLALEREQIVGKAVVEIEH